MDDCFELLFSPGGTYYYGKDGEKLVTHSELVSVSASHFAWKKYHINAWYAGSLNIKGLDGLPCETLKQCIASLPTEFKTVKQGNTLDETMENFTIASRKIQEHLRQNISTHAAVVSSIDTNFDNGLLNELQYWKAFMHI